MTMRTTTVLSALTVLTLSFAPGCKKDSATTIPDDPTGTTAEVLEPEVDPHALPAQDPDPPEIAALYQRYLIGDYEAVVSEAEQLRAGLTADTQVRAHAMAAAIGALAAIESVPEDGKTAAEEAVTQGDRLGDPEVQQLARIAHGAYLVRVHEAATGQAELEAALGLAGPYGPLAQLMLAEAHLNQAFGIGEDEDRIQNPAKLDEARTAYQAALDGGSDILKAHAHEGLAAIARYKNEKQAICDHAQEAENLFVAAGATDYVREVPQLLANEGRCQNFTKAR